MRIQIEGLVFKAAKMRMRIERILIAPLENKRGQAVVLTRPSFKFTTEIELPNVPRAMSKRCKW